MTLPAREHLTDARFVSLTTFRRDGRGVPTPVWVVPVPDGLGVWTPGDSGKVKRIRRDGAVTLAACDRRGRLSGPVLDGRARVLDRDGTARVRSAVRRKYGLLGKALTTLSGLRRGPGGVGIAIELN